MLNTFRRMYVSCYGITEEENHTITRKTLHAVFCDQMRRLLRLRRESGSGMKIEIGFRTIHNYSAEQLAQFQEKAFGEVIEVVVPTLFYNNWGGTMRGPLPGQARWVDEHENHTPCLALIIAMQVYHDGRVTACPCCDFDANPELSIGNVIEHTLVELFNNEKNCRLWHAHQAGKMPVLCRHCSFHRPMMDLDAHHLVLKNLAAFIGG
jgi:radical SAM protein with 4Fe4S-binding SPASM domain